MTSDKMGISVMTSDKMGISVRLRARREDRKPGGARAMLPPPAIQTEAADFIDALAEASAPIVAVVAALDGVYGFGDDDAVDARNFTHKWNDFPPLTWGDLRRLAAAIAKAKS